MLGLDYLLKMLKVKVVIFLLPPSTSAYFRYLSIYFQKERIFKFVENIVRTDNSVDTGSSFFSVES